MSDAVPDQMFLLAGGQLYGGWTRATAGRGLDRCTSHLDLEVSERWLGQDLAWPLLPFTPVTLLIGADPVLTGYIDDYAPMVDGQRHAVRVTGRSKTQDLVDCTPDIPSGQFAGFSVAAIATAICALFGIEVVVQSDNADQVIPVDATQRCETAWGFLDRLFKLGGVLATDDELGRLVLTNVGLLRASGALVEGVNVLRLAGHFSSHKRFSNYIVKGQSGLGRGVMTGAAVGSGAVQTQLEAVAIDPNVPRYRPTVKTAESQIDLATMQERANWQCNYAYGRSIEATLTVQGWRQPDGSLWRLNQIVPVTSSVLGVDQDLLIVGVDYRIDPQQGSTTELRVGPPDGYVPDPAQVKSRRLKGCKHGHGRGRAKGKGGGADPWAGVVA